MAAPTLTSIAPASGPTAGGTVVTLVGTSLDTVTAVSFGSDPASGFSALSAVLLVAVAPAGSGTVAVKVTNPDGDSGTLAYQLTDGLFTVAEARAFVRRGTMPLADEATYSDALITAAEAATREGFTDAVGVALVPTSTTAVVDGNCSRCLKLPVKNPARESPRRALTVTAASIDGVALTATELAAIKAHPDGRLVRADGNSWSSSTGYQDLAVSVTVTHGWATVPLRIKDAALLLCVRTLCGSDVPDEAVSFTDGGASYQFPRAGQAPHWYGCDAVDAVLVAFQENRVVIA